MDATVLIVDEDVNAQIVAQTLLGLRGLRVRLAADGAAACDLVRDENVAVVVLDLNLSGISGFELLRRLHDNGVAHREAQYPDARPWTAEPLRPR
jgi:CheY-like chemotaxis protein